MSCITNWVIKKNEQSTSFWFSHLDYEYIKYFFYMITIPAQFASKKIQAQITSKKKKTIPAQLEMCNTN